MIAAQQLSQWQMLGVIMVGIVAYFATEAVRYWWSRRRDSSKNCVRLIVRMREHRPHRLSSMMVRQHAEAACARALEFTPEFLEYVIEEAGRGLCTLHRVTYLIPRSTLGPVPTNRLQLIQTIILTRGFPCSVTTDPMVGSSTSTSFI